MAAKDHGLDVLAIYRDGTEYGLAIVECKAYESDPNGAINDAVKTFKQVDNGRHDSRIRQFVATVRSALPAAQQAPGVCVALEGPAVVRSEPAL